MSLPRIDVEPAGLVSLEEPTPLPWSEANRRYLMAALDVVRAALERHAARRRPSRDEIEDRGDAARGALAAAAAALPAPSALERLCAIFGLAGFERDVLLMCASVELDPTFAMLCAAAQGDSQRNYPTFHLALDALPGAHWDVLSSVSALRRWQLVEVGPGDALASSPLRLASRVLCFLLGIAEPDERLAGFIEPVAVPFELPPSHDAIARRVAAAWAEEDAGPLPVVQLHGGDAEDRLAIAAAACALLDRRLQRMPAHVVPNRSAETETLRRLWELEAALSGSVLALECESASMEPSREEILGWFLDRVRGGVVVLGDERRRAPQRRTLSFEVKRPTPSEQEAVWRTALGPAAEDLDGEVDRLVAGFDLGAPAIRTVSARALAEHRAGGAAANGLGPLLWTGSRIQARSRLEALAERIEPAAKWDDLILPGPQSEILREIVIHVRQRRRVADWGFAAGGRRGMGVTALFLGSSGTGKTMAAEVLARELELDLYRIDLSSVVNKYIGETEKNLRRLFDTAESGGVVLLFDEADALFGKRSAVESSHDRHANIEVSYLLQRMESYRGLAVLTTNLKDALDQAFLRRLRFVVDFPFPGPEDRERIWQSVFPDRTPTEGLDWEKLARLNVAGGTIRNIAVRAAFLAADQGEPVRMADLLRAVRSELLKMEKPLAQGDVRDWV